MTTPRSLTLGGYDLAPAPLDDRSFHFRQEPAFAGALSKNFGSEPIVPIALQGARKIFEAFTPPPTGHHCLRGNERVVF